MQLCRRTDHVETRSPPYVEPSVAGVTRTSRAREDQGRFRGMPDGAATRWGASWNRPPRKAEMTTTETPTSSIKELHRSREDRILAGVAGGLGRYFDLSPTFFRIAFVILTLVGGAGILIYVAAALVIPDEGRTDSIASEALRRHRDRPWLLAGVALVAIAVVSLVAQADFWPNSGFAWTLLLLGGAAIVIAQRRGNDGEPAPETGTEVRAPRQPSLFLPGVRPPAGRRRRTRTARGDRHRRAMDDRARRCRHRDRRRCCRRSVPPPAHRRPRRRRDHPRDARGHGLRRSTSASTGRSATARSAPSRQRTSSETTTSRSAA